MKTGYTPGPWEREGTFVYALQDYRKYKLNRFSFKINQDNRMSFGNLDEEMEANARLIAAAPELLENLKNAVNAMRRMDRKLLEITNSPFECEKGEIVDALKAIAKAEGK